jgi:hypothetical protein
VVLKGVLGCAYGGVSGLRRDFAFTHLQVGAEHEHLLVFEFVTHDISFQCTLIVYPCFKHLQAKKEGTQEEKKQGSRSPKNDR